MTLTMVLIKCRSCRSDIGVVEQGAKYELKCPKGCRVWTCGVA